MNLRQDYPVEPKFLLAVNSRFRKSQKSTGVQNWAKATVTQLMCFHQVEIKEIEPSNFFSNGIRGHIWEQLILPWRARKYDALLSPCNFGPVLYSRQIVCIHDALVFSHSKYFQRSYRIVCKIFHTIILRSKIKVVTVSLSSRMELEKIAKKGKRIEVVGMGLYNSPNAQHIIPSESPTFLFVGGHIARKNLKFLLAMWPSIFADTGAILKVTTSHSSKTLRTEDIPKTLGVEFINDPSDAALSQLYDSVNALLWPSLGEGFGMPLLEVMSHGKPFLATDSGAATELLVGRSKILPLDDRLWREAIVSMASIPNQKDNEQIKITRNYTWKLVAEKILRLLTSPQTNSIEYHYKTHAHHQSKIPSLKKKHHGG